MSRDRVAESTGNGSVFLIAGVILLLIFAKVLLIPLAFALTLAFLLLPAVTGLEKRGIKQTLAVAIACTAACAILAGAGYLLSRQVLRVAETLPGYSQNIETKIAALHSPSGESLSAAAVMIEDILAELLPTQAHFGTEPQPVRIVGQRSDQMRAQVSLIGSILEPVGQIGVVAIFTIYMLMNRRELRHRLLLLAGIGNLNATTRALQDATARISQYLVMQLEVNACYGLLFGTGLYFLQVPGAALWGVVAGALRIVPFVGTLMGTAVPLLLSIAISPDWVHPAEVVALFLVLELTTGNVVEPWLFTERTGISSLALLSSAIFWSMLWGWPGLVLSTPLTVCVVVLGRYVPQLSYLHSLLGTNAQLSPPAHMYERLLAMDQTEAWAIAERFLDGKPLAQLYDTVILPVLSLAERDRHLGALTEVQRNFVLLSMGELVARLTEYKPTGDSLESKSERSVLIEARQASLRKEFAVVCLSAGDAADQLTTVMLSQLLERAGYQTLLLVPEALSDEILHGLSAEPDTVLFISALPPFAFAQTRALCQRVRTHLPKNRIAVALWNSDEDTDELHARFGTARPEAVLSTLSHALAQVGTWRRTTRRT